MNYARYPSPARAYPTVHPTSGQGAAYAEPSSSSYRLAFAEQSRSRVQALHSEASQEPLGYGISYSGKDEAGEPPQPVVAVAMGAKPQNQLRATLSERHVNMMSFSQCIGIGLFLQAGRVIYLAGPGMGTLAYIITGTILWSSAACLGEMTALFPVKGPIIEFPRRFLDESVGFAAGWMTWFSWVVLIAAELVAVTHIFQFHFPEHLLAEAGYPEPTLSFSPSVSPSVIVFVFLLLMLGINMLPVRHFGQLEYVFGVAKMLFIILMILLNVGLHIAQRVPRGAFWTYNPPYSFTSQNITLPNAQVVTGGPGRLGGVFEAMTTCLFGMIGFETIAITAAENRDLRTEETVKIATRKISLRIITLYSLATFAVGLNVPYTYETIVDDRVISFGFGQNSAFVVSPVLNRLPQGWPRFVNGFIAFTATTAGTNGLYNASRTLHALASIPDVWPRWPLAQQIRRRLERTTYGVPHAAVFVSALFGILGFLADNPGSQLILGRLVRCCVICLMITYGLVAASFLSFYKCVNRAAKGQDENISDRDNPEVQQLYDRSSPRYPYRSRAQYLRAVYALVGCSVFVLFNGWRTFVHPMSGWDFVACYVPFMLLGFIIVLYQIKFWGWNPMRWRRRASGELQIPRPEIATSVPRRGHLALENTENLLDPRNLKALARWVWVWLK